MFDIGFWELAVIAILGLVILGPERLPVAIRTVAKYTRQFRTTWLSVRNEFMREMQEAELKKEVEKTMEAAREEFSELQTPSAERVAELDEITKEFKQSSCTYEESKAAAEPVAASKPQSEVTSQPEAIQSPQPEDKTKS
jgi:sec-independent protein translocase protein TatB